MTAPETLLATRIKQVLDAEFAPQSFVTEHTKLLRAAGRDGKTRLATSPNDANEHPRVVVQLDVEYLIQLYLGFDDDPDETRTVDPTVIVGYGDRIRRAFGPNSSGNTSDLWGLRVTTITYPDDPTGHKTRLEAIVVGYADNTAALAQ